ncbi:ead/Ea22-like family protein [Escherichia marmotae]|nr:ead/Ea22-like family protein [Escherichia marmotae]
MSKIDYQALREAAERAIPAMERLLMLPADDDLLSEQELKDYGVDIDALNAFKFLAGPETVLALLDERERNQQYIKRRDQENEMMVDAMHAAIALTSVGIDLDDYDECVLRLHEWGALPDYCIALYVDFVHGIVSKNKLLDFGYINGAPVWTLRDELEAAEKRIAELESNEVREVGNQFLVVRHPGKTPVIKHCTGDLEEFLRKLIEQDPLVTIDIITHRYYGIGGQWVQDAVEYLHMMSDAGIRIKGE